VRSGYPTAALGSVLDDRPASTTASCVVDAAWVLSRVGGPATLVAWGASTRSSRPGRVYVMLMAPLA
jgi:hypothetical protein